MDEDKKKRILEARNNFISELIEIIEGKNGVKELGDNIHPIEVKIKPITLSFNARRKESSFSKEETYKNMCNAHNKIKLDFGLHHLFNNTFSTCAFKSETAFEYSLEPLS